MITRIMPISFKGTSEVKSDVENKKDENHVSTAPAVQEAPKNDTFVASESASKPVEQPKKANILKGIVDALELMNTFMSLIPTSKSTKK